MVNKDHILVTGAAGFIGAALVKRLIKEDLIVIGIDNINDYYDQNLKQDRLFSIEKEKTKENWHFYQCDLNDGERLRKFS